MQIEPFSCVRPVPEQIGEVLSRTANQGFDSQAIGELLKNKLLTLDISRALYLVGYSDGERSYKALIACIENPAANADTAGYQTTPVRVVYPANMALDIILSAATAAVPLYNISNGASQLVVWRLSRPEALEAIQATFATIEPTLASNPSGSATIEPSLPNLPYPRTMVELVDETCATMPALPTGLFARKN